MSIFMSNILSILKFALERTKLMRTFRKPWLTKSSPSFATLVSDSSTRVVINVTPNTIFLIIND